MRFGRQKCSLTFRFRPGMDKYRLKHCTCGYVCLPPRPKSLRCFSRVHLAPTLSDRALRLFGLVCSATGNGKGLIVPARKWEGEPMNAPLRLQSLSPVQ
jgi:hypothetical protein